MDAYSFLYNPLVYNLLNIIFGILLVVGIGLLIMNLVKLATSNHRTGPIIGIIISLLILGISVKWETILSIILEIMGGVTQYLAIYLYQMIYQWLAQNPVPLTVLLM
nr:hypothetical protein [Candidatus Freyarchaeota archaeon]